MQSSSSSGSIEPFPRRGLMLVLSSPSGAGKTTISRALMDQEAKSNPGGLVLSISATTREKRPSEVDGVHYDFLSRGDFEAKRDSRQFLEWAEVHGNLYATPRERVEKLLDEGIDVLFDIDWQGTDQIRQQMPDDVVSVFILPPSADALRQRLERRAEDSDEVIQRRLRNACTEMEHWGDYSVVLVNDDMERAVTAVRAILQAERLRRTDKAGIAAFVDSLIDDLS
ncbi:MAG: guanylate kinase [Pseudomonadota bacterium]